LHKNEFGGQAPPGPAGRAISAHPDHLAVIRGGEGGKGRKGFGIAGRGGKGKA